MARPSGHEIGGFGHLSPPVRRRTLSGFLPDLAAPRLARPFSGAASVTPVDDIAARLRESAEAVARHYCSGAGAYVERGQYYCLNPGRADRSVGSFFVTLRGSFQGRWRDMATGEHGDMLDLIGMALGCDKVGAVQEAKAFLGIDDGPKRDPAKLERAAAARRDDEDVAKERRRALAFRMWCDARPIEGTPADAYLIGRGIDLRALGRTPSALRFARACPFNQVDPDTGEVLEGAAPAMLTYVTGRDGRMASLHRTWLGERGGRWVKAALPKPKMVLGGFMGGGARLWRGRDAHGRYAPRLAQAPQGSRVVLCEGVEDALAIALLRPDLRVIAAISLGNLGTVALPDAIAEVIVAGDNDTHPEAKDALQRAVDQRRAEGRIVRLWRSPAGKDAGDLIQAVRGAA